jgi:hypothetical protein
LIATIVPLWQIMPTKTVPIPFSCCDLALLQIIWWQLNFSKFEDLPSQPDPIWGRPIRRSDLCCLWTGMNDMATDQPDSFGFWKAVQISETNNVVGSDTAATPVN